MQGLSDSAENADEPNEENNQYDRELLVGTRDRFISEYGDLSIRRITVKGLVNTKESIIISESGVSPGNRLSSFDPHRFMNIRSADSAGGCNLPMFLGAGNLQQRPIRIYKLLRSWRRNTVLSQTCGLSGIRIQLRAESENRKPGIQCQYRVRLVKHRYIIFLLLNSTISCSV